MIAAWAIQALTEQQATPEMTAKMATMEIPETAQPVVSAPAAGHQVARAALAAAVLEQAATFSSPKAAH